MPRRRVKWAPEQYYHLYNRGHNRGAIAVERENHVHFLRLLRRYLLPVAEILAYCLMPTHYHLIICIRESGKAGAPQDSQLSTAMMRLSVAYTKAMNKRYHRVGALFQGPFHAKHVETDRYLLHLSRYVHLNPVLSGLCERPEDWEFSSYAEYLGTRGGTLPSPAGVLSLIGAPGAYRAFVEVYTPEDEGTLAGLTIE